LECDGDQFAGFKLRDFRGAVHIQNREAISNPCCASMCLNRFTPEYRLKPWISGPVQHGFFIKQGIDNCRPGDIALAK
jgi:hypothetical protein